MTKKSIWPPYEAFYIRSMMFNAAAAAGSVEQINAVMHVVQENNPEDPVSTLPVQYLLGELQSLVVHAAALSRYFWPARAQHHWRGAQLRHAFGIVEESPLKSRDLRNAIEHFDEHLDRFLENGPVGNILPEYVGPFVEPDGVPVHLFRAYYLDTGVFELLGQRYDIPSLAREVMRVRANLQRMDSTSGRLAREDASIERTSNRLRRSGAAHVKRC